MSGPSALRPLARQGFQLGLQRRVDGQAVNARVRLQRHDMIGRMRREGRHRLARMRHRLRLGARDFIARHDALRHGTRSSTRSRAARARVGIAIRPPRFRRLRQRHQQRRFAERQPARLLAEIGQRGGADAFEIAAIGRQRQIERQDLRLAQRMFEFERARHLAQLGAEAAVLARLQQPRHLHGQESIRPRRYGR